MTFEEEKQPLPVTQKEGNLENKYHDLTSLLPSDLKLETSTGQT